MNQYTKLYQDLIDVIQMLGGKVKHLNLKKSGYFQYSNKQIGMPHKDRNTLRGCYLLAHELGHFIDFENGKFKKWFSHKLMKRRKWISPSLIRKFEGSANDFAKEVFKNRNISFETIEELGRGFEEYLIPYWTLLYNGIIDRRENVKKEIEKVYKQVGLVPYWLQKKKHEKVKKHSNRSPRNRRGFGRSGR